MWQRDEGAHGNQPGLPRPGLQHVKLDRRSINDHQRPAMVDAGAHACTRYGRQMQGSIQRMEDRWCVDIDDCSHVISMVTLVTVLCP